MTQEKNLCDIGFGDGFLDTTPKTQPVRKIGKLNFTKI